MGVEFEIELFARTDLEAAAAIDAAFARIAALDKALSDYDPASELSRLSQTASVPPGADRAVPPATAKPISLSDDLWRVLHYSQELSRESDGAFDVTIGPLTKLWRRARRQRELPADDRLAEARAAVGYKFLRLDEVHRSAQLLRPNLRLDLGGIAKGFAADEALAVIKRRGIARALVRASGDIAVGEAPPGQAGWMIGIAPLDPDDPPTRFVRLAQRAISTSGDSRQHLVVEGRRYSHIIDPRTGLGVPGRSSVTVIAPTSMEADAVATAVSVLGPERGRALVEGRQDVELYMVAQDDQGHEREVTTPGFAKYVEPLKRDPSRPGKQEPPAP
jgi:thiamine biosynthesis lipoprotein